jgi:signal transduction histidine kinase
MNSLNVRHRIALLFVGLSTLVYIVPTILGAFLFYFSLTAALDSELRYLVSSLGHAIELKGSKPHFRDWARIVQTNPSRSLFSIQLFDAEGKMLEHYGLEGIPVLLRDQHEAHSDDKSVRIMVSPLKFNGTIVGYLQIEVSTKERDAATRQFGWVMALMAPVVLLGLGTCSYYVSDKATMSIRQTVEMLREFMADAGHELNTPLSIVHASTEALQRKLDKQGVVLNEPGVIASSSDRMQKIIDDLVLLAEIEAPIKSNNKLQRIDVREVVEQGLVEFAVKFEDGGVKLDHSEIPASFVMGDPDAVKVLFSNLLENALRYTDPGGAVRVELSREGGYLCLTVSDSGIGIPEESLPRIFERFYRVDKSRSRSSGGSGLGLSIVKAIAQAHQGDVSVSSKVGEGSKFTVRLPVLTS